LKFGGVFKPRLLASVRIWGGFALGFVSLLSTWWSTCTLGWEELEVMLLTFADAALFVPPRPQSDSQGTPTVGVFFTSVYSTQPVSLQMGQ
jgi:hypothetical protein